MDREKKVSSKVNRLWPWLFLPLICLVAAEVSRDWLPAVDGPYQTAGACRQILAGNFPGSDFVVFHGLLTMWYHAGFYALMGGSVAGTVAAYVSACVFVVWIPVFAFLRFAGVGRWEALFFGLLTINGALLIPPPVYNAFFPGGNMLGTRVALAIGVALVLWRVLRTSSWRGFKAGLLAGLVPALGLLISQEQGMALGAAVLGTGIWYGLVRRRFGFAELISGGGGSLLSFLLVYTGGVCLLTGFDPMPYWHFAWREIPSNQFWFFGKPPEGFITWRDALDIKKVLAPALLSFGVWAFGLFLARRGGHLKGWTGALIGFLLVYSLAVLHPLAGYRHAHYFAPAIHVGILVLVLGLLPFLRRTRDKLEGRRLSAATAVLALVLCGLQWIKTDLKELLMGGSGEPAPKLLLAHPSFDGMGEVVGEAERVRRWRDYVGPSARVWSMWSGPLEEALEQPPVSRFDYVIYALSEESEGEYRARFREFAPTHVVTGRESSGFIFQWMMKRYWPIYRELLRDFRPVAAINARVLWERRGDAPEQLNETVVSSEVNGSGTRASLSFQVEAGENETAVHEVRLCYRLLDPPVPLLSLRLTRISVKAKGVPGWREIGIRVNAEGELTEFSIPVVTAGPHKVELLLEAMSPFGGPDLEIESVEVNKLDGGLPEAAWILYDDAML